MDPAGVHNVVVVKVGGSVLTVKAELRQLRPEGLEVAAAVVRACWQRRTPVVLVIGAGSFGHIVAQRYGFSSQVPSPAVPERAMDTQRALHALEVHRSVADLARIVETHLCERHAIPAVAVCFPHWQLDDAAFHGSARASLHALLSHGVTPVLFGDMRFSGGDAHVLSGDTMAPFCCTLLAARRLLLVCSWPVMTHDPVTRAATARVVSEHPVCICALTCRVCVRATRCASR